MWWQARLSQKWRLQPFALSQAQRHSETCPHLETPKISDPRVELGQHHTPLPFSILRRERRAGWNVHFSQSNHFSAYLFFPNRRSSSASLLPVSEKCAFSSFTSEMERWEWLDRNKQVTVTFLSNGTVDNYDYLISIPESHLGLMQRCFDVPVDTLPAVREA